MRWREIGEDVGWLLVIVLLLPLAIPVAMVAIAFLLGQRLTRGLRRQTA